MNNDIKLQKLEMWEKKLAEANAFLGDALKKKSEAMNVGYLSENAYKMAIEEIEIGHARIGEINRIINSLKTGNEDKQSFSANKNSRD